MKSFIMAVLVLFAVNSYGDRNADLKIDASDVIQIETVSVMPDGSFGTVSGTVTGVTTAPKGDYRVKITNGKGFKGDNFSVMSCNILPLDEIKYVKGESIPLATTFIVEGDMYHVMGFYSGTDKFPTDGYQVIIKNGKSRPEWNSMNCRIK